MRFSGRAATIKCYENNPLVRAAFEEPGEGRVLVVDGGGSKRCALLGDNIAAMAAKNGWSVSFLRGGRGGGRRLGLWVGMLVWTVGGGGGGGGGGCSYTGALCVCRHLTS
jgi:hypothetical protein